jgi:hypothetical protein
VTTVTRCAVLRPRGPGHGAAVDAPFSGRRGPGHGAAVDAPFSGAAAPATGPPSLRRSQPADRESRLVRDAAA